MFEWWHNFVYDQEVFLGTVIITGFILVFGVLIFLMGKDVYK